MQTTIKTIDKEQEGKIKHIASMFGYENLTFYHGDITISFRTNSLTPMEVSHFESIGMKLGGISCFTDQKTKLGYMRVSMEMVQ